jgi:hypothetical protein
LSNEGGPLEPIRILLADADLAGFLQPLSERVTDLLQRGSPISFLPAGARPDEWIEIRTTDILMVVPAPLTRRFGPREQRVLRRVAMRVGPYAAEGVAYLKPGQEHDLMLRATRPFMPMTEAIFARADAPEHESVETLIVNLNWVANLREA